MFDRRSRAEVERGLKPVGSALQRSGVKADQLTFLGLALSAATAIAVGGGRLVLGLFLLIGAGATDLLDGAVAKGSGTASARGGFFDSVADRVSDALILGGVAWYLAGWRGGRWPVLALAVLAVSMLVSYERAKAESLGFHARGGLMERAERMIALAVGFAFRVVLVPVLWVMLALTTVTALYRFVSVWQQASAPRPPRPERRWSRRRTPRSLHVERSRAERPWRTWRERARTRP